MNKEVSSVAQWGAKFVKCPYYHDHDSNRIVCEGISQGNTINLVFGNQLERGQYMKDNCNTIDGCRKCPLHGLLDRKYT